MNDFKGQLAARFGVCCSEDPEKQEEQQEVAPLSNKEQFLEKMLKLTPSLDLNVTHKKIPERMREWRNGGGSLERLVDKLDALPEHLQGVGIITPLRAVIRNLLYEERLVRAQDALYEETSAADNSIKEFRSALVAYQKKKKKKPIRKSVTVMGESRDGRGSRKEQVWAETLSAYEARLSLWEAQMRIAYAAVILWRQQVTVAVAHRRRAFNGWYEPIAPHERVSCCPLLGRCVACRFDEQPNWIVVGS
tara:strand:+ start:246 stop:992 length:747 start_codon:yes stop_codon:yes gene_type:complete